MTQTTINYEEELSQLSTNNYWKPTEGKHKIRILSEPEDTEYINDKGETTKQWKLQIELLESKDGKGTMTWKFPKSMSPASLRGQLVKLGAKNKKLNGVSLDVFIQGKGKERRYTIPDAL